MLMQRISVWDEVDEFLLSKPSPEEVLEFQLSEQAQDRAAYLTETNRESHLATDEQLDMDEYLAVEKFVRRLKAKALAKINS